MQPCAVRLSDTEADGGVEPRDGVAGIRRDEASEWQAGIEADAECAGAGKGERAVIRHTRSSPVRRFHPCKGTAFALVPLSLLRC